MENEKTITPLVIIHNKQKLVFKRETETNSKGLTTAVFIRIPINVVHNTVVLLQFKSSVLLKKKIKTVEKEL